MNSTLTIPILHSMPNAVELERSVLGALLIDQHAISTVYDILSPASFYDVKNSIIYSAIASLYEENIPIDLLLTYERIKQKGEIENVGGLDYLIKICGQVASSANIEHWARILVQKQIQRDISHMGHRIINDSMSNEIDVFELIDSIEENVYNISSIHTKGSFERLSRATIQARKQIEAASKNVNSITGISTGCAGLDRITGGWQNSDLVIVAARPGMGKTAFALSLAHNAAMTGKSVAFFSLEMSSTQLSLRLISSISGISSYRLRNGRLTKSDWDSLNEAVHTINDLPIYIDDTASISIHDIKSKCMRLQQMQGLDMVFVDYLQLATAGAKGRPREQEISAISRGLKALAKELNIPVIALSQLSRAVEKRPDKRPILSDLRESGAIEQDADIVAFIYRSAYYDLDDELENTDSAEIIIAKHRSGSLATVELKFVPAFVRFEENNKEFVSPSHNAQQNIRNANPDIPF